MDTRLLRYFVAVVDHENFTRAAEQLNITQPPLSIAIKNLESSLDLELLKRTGKSIKLTREGEVLYHHATIILQQLDDAQLAMDELKGLEKGEVRLGVPGMMGSYFFPEIVMAFKSKYPRLKLRLIEAGTRAIRSMLTKGELDIGVILNEKVPDELETDQIFRCEMVAVVSEQHKLASRSSLTFKEFFKYELVMFGEGYFHRDFIETISKQQGLAVNFSFETNLLPMILKLVRNGFAITALLDLVTEFEGGIVGIPFQDPVHLNLALAWRKDGYLSKADRTFIDFIHDYSADSISFTTSSRV